MAAIWGFVIAPEIAAANSEGDAGPRRGSANLERGLNDASDADAGDDDSQGNGEVDSDDDGVRQYMEEVFLGRVVYPQDKGEVQITEGYFKGVESVSDALLFTELEYGVTDRFQIGLDVPVELNPGESFDGVRQLGVEAYWNCYSNGETGRAYGMGLEVGAPIDAPDGEALSVVYEPFFIAYQDFGRFAGNLSAAVEIEDPTSGDEQVMTTGDLAAALFAEVGPFVALLECQVEIQADDTPVRLAPGLYIPRFYNALDVAVSLPVGLNREAPQFGVFLLAIVEFETLSN